MAKTIPQKLDDVCLQNIDEETKDQKIKQK
jgi:hypothetical protein